MQALTQSKRLAIFNKSNSFIFGTDASANAVLAKLKKGAKNLIETIVAINTQVLPQPE